MQPTNFIFENIVLRNKIHNEFINLGLFEDDNLVRCNVQLSNVTVKALALDEDQSITVVYTTNDTQSKVNYEEYMRVLLSTDDMAMLHNEIFFGDDNTTY